MRRNAVRCLIIVLGLLVNLAIAESASAGFRNAVCQDPQTGEVFGCCVWCMFFCDCDFESPAP